MLVSTLGHGRVRARITETEAYLGYDDPASHAYRGRRHVGNASLYLAPGHWYVYRSYGIHWCANLVAAPAGRGGAVLLRGVEILEGRELVKRRRAGVLAGQWSNGPGKLCQALAIDRGLDGLPMRTSPVTVWPSEVSEAEVVAVTPRIGITKAVNWPLRFLLSTLRP